MQDRGVYVLGGVVTNQIKMHEIVFKKVKTFYDLSFYGFNKCLTTGCFYSMTRFQQALNGASLKILTCGLLQIVGTKRGFFSYMIHEDTTKIVEMRAI